MDLLSHITKYKYNTIHECDEMAYSFKKSWTNHKRQVFTYQVSVCFKYKKNIHGTTM
jgi:hypothetical protein